MKTDKDNDQVFMNELLKMICCLNFDVYNNNNIDIDFLNKVEVNKEYRQNVMNSENVDFCGSLIQKFQRIKILTMVIVYEKEIQNFCLRVFVHNFKCLTIEIM